MSHLKTPFSETHSKTYFNREKCKKQEDENVGTIHINICKRYAALQNHVKAMHTGHMEQYFKYFLLYFSQDRFKNY
jgi:hypothetical protein